MNYDDFQNNYDSYGDGTYSFPEDEIRNASFKVTLYGTRFGAHIMALMVPTFFYILLHPMIEGLKYIGDTIFSGMFNIMFFSLFAMCIILIIINKGKEIVVSGRGIVIRKCFIFQESVNVNEVYKCQVITGLTSRSRYHTEHFNRAVIYYGNGYKVAVNDNMYKNWDQLVKYMELAQKTVYIDGRSRIEKMIDSWLKR